MAPFMFFVVIVLPCTVPVLGPVLMLLSVPGTVRVHGAVPVFCSHCPFMYSPCPWPCPMGTLCPRSVRVHGTVPVYVVIVLSCTVPILGPVLRLLSVPGTVRVHDTVPVFFVVLVLSRTFTLCVLGFYFSFFLTRSTLRISENMTVFLYIKGPPGA
jgi:hypothetical protein